MMRMMFVYELVPCCLDRNSGWVSPLQWGSGLASQRWGLSQYQWCLVRRGRREGSALLGGCLKLAGWKESGGQVLHKENPTNVIVLNFT